MKYYCTQAMIHVKDLYFKYISKTIKMSYSKYQNLEVGFW